MPAGDGRAAAVELARIVTNDASSAYGAPNASPSPAFQAASRRARTPVAMLRASGAWAESVPSTARVSVPVGFSWVVLTVLSFE